MSSHEVSSRKGVPYKHIGAELAVRINKCYSYCIVCCSCEYIIAHTNNDAHSDVICLTHATNIHMHTFMNKLSVCPQCGDMTDVYPTDSPYYLEASKNKINKPKKKLSVLGYEIGDLEV